MKNFILGFLFFVSSFYSIYGQKKQYLNTTAQNNIYLEILGNGFFYSLNYERFFNRNISARAGIMIFPASGTSDEGHTLDITLLFFPIMANYLFNFGNHNIELGVGPEVVYASGSTDIAGNFSGFAFAATARIGYLYFPTDGGFNIRIAYTPILSEVFTHSVGIGVGYSW
jgi:hypothetical protein